jgi:sugar lactone lactonase YvrE
MACFGSFGQGVTCLDELGQWQTYTKENSPLGSNLVQAMAACPDHRVAIVHSFGVSVFDGKDWREYAEGWGNASPNDITCDSNGHFWVAHFGGVSHFDGKAWTTYGSKEFAANSEPDALVDTIAAAPDGTIWVSSSNSIGHFTDEQWEVYEIGHGFDDQYFFDAVTVDNQGWPWASHGGGIFTYDGNTWTEYENRDLFVSNSIAVDSNGEVWVGTFSQGIRIFDGQGGWRSLDMSTGDLSSNHVPVMDVDAQGRMWIATEWGLNVIDGSDWQIYYMHNADLVDNYIRTIAVAGAGPELPQPVEKEPGTLTGQLTLRDGTPIADAAVEVCVTRINESFSGSTPCADQSYFRQTTTDAAGNFTVDNLPPGYYRLAANDSQIGWIIVEKYTSSLEDDRVLVEPGQETDLLQVIVSTDE